MVLQRVLELARKSDPNPDPAGAPGMCLHGGQASRPFWVSVMNPVFEDGELVLEFSFKNPCGQGSSSFSREEARPLGYLGEFLFSIHVHMNQPQLSQRDWRLLNKWLISARLEDLHALSPAFKQAVLDWARSMPSLINGRNCVPEGQPGVTDDGWRRWTHDAIDKLMAQYSRPLGDLPPQIMACLKQAHYTLGAGSFDGDGLTGFGTPGGSGRPFKGLEPATPQPAQSSEITSYKRSRVGPLQGQSKSSATFGSANLEGLNAATPSWQGHSGPANPFLQQLQSDAEACRPEKEARRGSTEGLRRSSRHRTHSAFPSRDLSDLSEETLAILEPLELSDLQELEACLAEGQPDEVQTSLESDAGQHSRLLSDARSRQDIQRSSGGAVIVGKASWMGCLLPPDLLDIDPEAFPVFKRKREVWEGPPASKLELHKTLDHLENNEIGIADMAGSLSSASLQPTLLDDPFALESLPDPPLPSLAVSGRDPSVLNFATLLPSPTLEAHPLSPPAQDASPAVHSSNCSNPPAAAATPSMSQQPASPFAPSPTLNTGEAGDVSDEQRLQASEPRDPASVHWRQALQQASRPTRVKLDQGGAGVPPITTPQLCHLSQAGSSSQKRQSNHCSQPHRTSTLEGFNPYATADAESWFPHEQHRRVPSELTSPTPPLRADAPSPPLRLSLQQLPRTLQHVQDGIPLSGSMEALNPPPQAARPSQTPDMGLGRRMLHHSTTPPTGYGSRVVSGGMTSAAMASHEELMGLPLVGGPRTRSISAPIVRQGPAILRSKLSPHRGPGRGSGHASGRPNCSPRGFQEPRRHSAGSVRTPTPVGMWLPEAPGGVLRSGDPTRHDPTHPLGDLDLSPTAFPLRESSSISWGTIEAIAAGYVPALDGTS
ncbi:hypothetical protein WJX74_011014 [Apatococcus lobatus]|uniref:Uncharacterized protein n=1 Tax=Apatococcus lobatus TaxID=904363 RepID=A0AAW1QWE2_9CHLO